MGGGDPSGGGKLLGSVVEGKRDADSGRIVDKDGITPLERDQEGSWRGVPLDEVAKIWTIYKQHYLM